MVLEEKLGFTKICEYVVAECSNPLAVRMAHEIRFSSNYERVMRELRQTEEFRQILVVDSGFPQQDFLDLTEELSRLRVGNTVIDIQALFDLKCSLRTIQECLRFLLRDDRDRYPTLRALAEKVELDPTLSKTLAKLIDDKGDIYDNASPDLAEIRSLIRRKQGEVDSRISQTLRRAKQEGWAPENAEVTIRNGRLVIPMLDTHRRKIKGIIQDESATRQTAYLEPSEVVELNNDLRELEFEERREIQRILARFSDQLRGQLDPLINAYWFLAKIDFIRAKAKLALTLRAGMPNVSNVTQIGWLEARHPLLYLNYLKEHREHEVQPFDLTLSDEGHILIISGPNAGGKSVCLKAVGLIQYMLQCGLLVPCRETSEFGIFEQVFIDIGDQQSIDDDLSTYTSHLQNMKLLLKGATSQTLFLLDELGGGTEPRSGCAIAEALLEELYLRHAYGVVTTHFADLKLLADAYPGIVNGAMLFDTKLMKPLYRLSIGHPGSSFAFEIAKSVGFPQDVLRAAEGKVGKEMLNFEHQLQQIDLDKQEIAKKQKELEVQDLFLNEVITKYQGLTEKVEAKRYDILTKARQEAKQILADANRTVEQTISDIKKAQAEKEKTQQARKAMRAEAERLESQQEKHDELLRRVETGSAPSQTWNANSPSRGGETRQASSLQEDVADGPIVVGDIVRVDGQETFGQVVEIKGKKATIESNSLRMTIPLSRLSKTRKKALPVDKAARKNERYQSIYDDINEKRKYFQPTLDLRGERADDALSKLEKFLDEAQMLSEKELRILHGKGYGILKTLVRERLMAMKEVQSCHSERLELGGDGVTVVHLR